MAAADRSCMGCAMREPSGERRWRCSLDRDMQVNGRMHCERWTDGK